MKFKPIKFINFASTILRIIHLKTIEITSELLSLYFNKVQALEVNVSFKTWNWFSIISQNFQRINSNSLEEIMKKRRKQLVSILPNKNPDYYEIAIDLRWSDGLEETRKKLLRLTSLRAYKCMLMRKIS